MVEGTRPNRVACGVSSSQISRISFGGIHTTQLKVAARAAALVRSCQSTPNLSQYSDPHFIALK